MLYQNKIFPLYIIIDYRLFNEEWLIPRFSLYFTLTEFKSLMLKRYNVFVLIFILPVVPLFELLDNWNCDTLNVGGKCWSWIKKSLQDILSYFLFRGQEERRKK